MTREEIEARRKGPWKSKWRHIYYCPEDPRVIVPRGIKWMGWTINFARPSAIPTLLLIVAFLIIPLRMVEGQGVVTVRFTFAAEIVALCLVCACLSSRNK